MIRPPTKTWRFHPGQIAVLLGVQLAFGHAPSIAYQAPAIKSTSPVKDFAPGVRIDWPNQTVEVDAKIVLRAGPLELFACSPQTREHESVIVVSARPMHIFQAMGIAGLEPGTPVRYDETLDVSFPPRGTSLDLRVRFRDAGKTRLIPIEHWMRRVKQKQPPEWIDWVFAGSKTYKGGRFGADADGTVVCVVDFDTALISVGAIKSADNDSLWLEANTERIPPIDTPCTLLISRTAAFDVSRDGAIRRAGKPMTFAEVAKAVGVTGEGAQTRRLILRPAPDVSADTHGSSVEGLVRAGIARSAITIRRPSPHKQPKKGNSSPG